MRVRAQDINGDYTLGKGTQEFFSNSASCVAQLIKTALLLIQGEWFLDLTTGVPYATQVLGYNPGATYDLVIRSVILNVQGVREIINYSSTLSARRALTVSVQVSTIFGTTQVQVTLNPFIFTQGGYGVGGYGSRGYGL